MKCDICSGPIVEQEVTYTLETGGKFIVVERVPAKVCLQCGEKLYSAETVERLQVTVWGEKQPSRVLETPVFDFSEA